jgi:hypothetical protein
MFGMKKFVPGTSGLEIMSSRGPGSVFKDIWSEHGSMQFDSCLKGKVRKSKNKQDIVHSV